MELAVGILGLVAVAQVGGLIYVIRYFSEERTQAAVGFSTEREKLMRAALMQQNAPAAVAFTPQRINDEPRERTPAPIGMN